MNDCSNGGRKDGAQGENAQIRPNRRKNGQEKYRYQRITNYMVGIKENYEGQGRKGKKLQRSGIIIKRYRSKTKGVTRNCNREMER